MSSHPYPYEERPELVGFIPPGVASVLDVGCSSGGFGASVRRARPHVALVGVEANQGAAALASKLYDDVVVGTFPDALDGDARSFDLVCFNDVLEHMIDPWDALRESKRWLSASGRVMACIPNVRSVHVLIELVVRGQWRYADTGLLDRTHLRFFTKRSMADLFESSGFRVDSVTGIYPLASRFRLQRLTPVLLRDMAFLEFVVVASPA